MDPRCKGNGRSVPASPAAKLPLHQLYTSFNFLAELEDVPTFPAGLQYKPWCGKPCHVSVKQSPVQCRTEAAAYTTSPAGCASISDLVCDHVELAEISAAGCCEMLPGGTPVYCDVSIGYNTTQRK